MSKRDQIESIYNPPFYLHKIHNYEKAVYERKGHWTEKQKVKYGVFLEIFREKFEDRENPILNKMFRVMSDFIKTRNHNQCRSHHQKMERQRFQIDSILESIRSKYHPREYELFFQKYSRHVKALNTESVLNQKGFTPHKNVEKRRKQKLKKAKRELKQTIPNVNKIQEIESVKISKPQKNQQDSRLDSGNGKIIQIKLTEEKQIFIPIVGQKKIYEEIIILPIVEKLEAAYKKEIDQKDCKALKKTGLQYDSDSDDEDERPEIAFVDIPMEAEILNHKENSLERMKPIMGSHYPLHSSHPSSHLPIPPFRGLPHYEGHFNQQFPVCSSPIGYNESYGLSLEQLQERKKWHLKQANRMCLEMNEHLQQANMCESMRQAMMKQMMDMGRGFYYPGHYASSQY